MWKYLLIILDLDKFKILFIFSNKSQYLHRIPLFYSDTQYESAAFFGYIEILYFNQ